MKWYWIVGIVVVVVLLTIWGTSRYYKSKAKKAGANGSGSKGSCGRLPEDPGYYTCVGGKWKTLQSVGEPVGGEYVEQSEEGYLGGLNSRLNGN